MSQALFYLLPESDCLDTIKSELYAFVCQLAKQCYQQDQRAYIHCQDQEQAYAIDELLWQLQPDSFVPHNLKGEGPPMGAPIEIGFDNIGSTAKRQTLINLALNSPAFAVKFSHIIDFVTPEIDKKTFARERYREYRQLGFTLSTQNLTTHPINFA